MVDRPAAVDSAPRFEGHGDLQERMREFLDRSGSGSSRLAERLLPAGSSDRPTGGQAGQGSSSFPWLLIAGWLADRFGLTSTAGGRALFTELRWIQFCVYGLFRVQDDLVDGDVDDAMLVIEANRLLTEATRRASCHFGANSSFWTTFTDSIDATSRAVALIDEVQSAPEREPHVELELYRDLSACLEIAAGGVALASERERVWNEAISPALGRLAVAGQILDDLLDLEDDLTAGRINYAAWYLCRPVFGSTREAIEAVVASNLATTDRLDGLLGTARRLLQEAAGLLTADICPCSHAYLLDYERSIEALGRTVADGCAALFTPRAWAA